MTAPTKSPILEARSITKSFPGVLALDGVSLSLFPGEVHALVGENGAGKSTLMKVLGGIHQPDSGEILLDGQTTTIHNPAEAQAKGISIIHQELNLMPDLSVAENIFFGREPTTAGMLRDRATIADASALLSRVGMQIDPRTPVGELTVAQQQMIEIAKSLSFDAKVLIMDEPTAALTDREVERLFDVVEELKSEGKAIVYISHRMDEIKSIADRITVMRDGQYVATEESVDMPVGRIIELMVGRQIDSSLRPSDEKLSDEITLEIRDLSTDQLLQDINLELHRGEILGIAGLMGAGRTEVARALIGADPKRSGQIFVSGREVTINTPADAVDNSIAYLSEDRKRYGLLLDKDLVYNTALPSYKLWSKLGMIDDSAAHTVAQQYVDNLRVKTPSVRQQARNLSGGNQQKVVLGKWLARDCDILIFDEPTRGIDVGSKEEIYDLLNALAASGKSLIVISSEIPELLRLAQRILVMCDGRITGELTNAEATQEKIMTLATSFGKVPDAKESK